MWVVADEGEILEPEIVDRAHGRIELHAGQRARLAGELFPRLREVVPVEMEIAEGVDEFAAREAADLRDHFREQGVARDVEGDAEKKIRAALVKLAAERAILHVKLEERV